MDAAPGYVGSVVSEANETGVPKGKNLEEVSDFGENEGNNPSFDIGDENDPGRLAQQKMQRTTQSSAGSTGPRQKMGESDGSQYVGLSGFVIPFFCDLSKVLSRRDAPRACLITPDAFLNDVAEFNPMNRMSSRRIRTYKGGFVVRDPCDGGKTVKGSS